MTFDQNVLAYGDNLDYLRAMPAESVDLVYLDPPFNTGRAFNNTMGTDAQAKAYDDTWTWGKDDERALRHFAKEHPELGKFLWRLVPFCLRRAYIPIWCQCRRGCLNCTAY